ncbi:MAG: hypothetical protein L6N95_01150 [Candidatus Methylarchaceae archaeon HK01B]|nr:hypothetical protein [Candidatus Methylarchaceae archaeon HK01B]
MIDGLGFFVSRSGKLHKVSSIKEYGNYVKFITDCGQYIVVRNSRRSKAARWIRNGWMKSSCKGCKIKSGELSRFKICR